MGNPTVYGGSKQQSESRRLSETSQESPCPTDTIDMQLKLPGFKKCMTSSELATHIITNFLTGGATGAATLVGGIAQEAGVDNTHARRAMSIAMRNGNVQEALMAEATRNPAAVVNLVGQLERFGLQQSVPFVGQLGATARGALSAAGEVGGKVLDGAIEVGGQVADSAVEVGGAVFNGAKDVLGGVGNFFGVTPAPEPTPAAPTPTTAPVSRTFPRTIPVQDRKKSRF